MYFTNFIQSGRYNLPLVASQVSIWYQNINWCITCMNCKTWNWYVHMKGNKRNDLHTKSLQICQTVLSHVPLFSQLYFYFNVFIAYSILALEFLENNFLNIRVGVRSVRVQYRVLKSSSLFSSIDLPIFEFNLTLIITYF